jgi:hypothetical protein
MKRAQVSNYILIGFLILFLAIIITSSSSIIVSIYDQSISSAETSPEGFLKSCSINVISRSFRQLGLTAGLMKFNDPVFIVTGRPVNVMVKNDSVRNVSEEQMINNLRADILHGFDECTKQLDELYPFDVVRGKPHLSLELAESSVHFTFEPEVRLDYGDRITVMKKIYIDYPVRLKEVFNFYKNIAVGLSEFTEAISLTDLHKDSRINATVLVPSENNMIFIFEDYGSDIEGNPFVFIFGRETG